MKRIKSTKAVLGEILSDVFLDVGSTPTISTRTRSVELYSFSRMSSRLSINSRVANSNPRFLCGAIGSA